MPRDVALEAEAEREGAVGAADATPSNRTRPSTRTRRGVLTLAATGLFAATTVTAFDVEMAQAVASAPAGVDTPQARDALRAALVENIVQTKAPAVLRLVFHDSGTYRQATGDGGMNGSVRFELTRPESFGLKRGLGPVTKVYEATRAGPAAGLSFADVIAAAGAYAVELTGGPKMEVSFGRVDADGADPENRMPAETLSGAETRAQFASAGYSTQEMVALAGAHTIGGKGFGEPYVFDNQYYRTLLKRPWADPNATKDDLEMASHIGLTSDKNLAVDAPSVEWIEKYAADQELFFRDFTAAYKKMTEQGARFAAEV